MLCFVDEAVSLLGHKKPIWGQTSPNCPLTCQKHKWPHLPSPKLSTCVSLHVQHVLYIARLEQVQFLKFAHCGYVPQIFNSLVVSQISYHCGSSSLSFQLQWEISVCTWWVPTKLDITPQCMFFDVSYDIRMKGTWSWKYLLGISRFRNDKFKNFAHWQIHPDSSRWSCRHIA